jgi:L-seryl-tRNA(Ser) seleniumtransferase
VTSGAIVVCSTDKLVGGPQGGLILGPAEWIDRIRTNPFARAFRPDKMVVAGFAETLAIYRDHNQALQEIPILRMLTQEPAVIRERANRLATLIAGARLEEGQSAVGGGAFPESELSTTIVAVPTSHVDGVLDRLRLGTPPIIARAGEDAVLLDPRTLADADIETVSRAVATARK